jgi:hypothetical protein
MAKAVHENFESFALVPEKIRVEEPDISVLPHEGDSPRWIDLAVRIDVSGPNSPDDFKVVSTSAVRREAAEQIQAQESVESNEDDFN